MSGEPQCADALLLVRPATFASNAQTAATNAFQGAPPVGVARDGVREAVLHEFDQMAALLADDLRVHVIADTPEPAKPDAVFPNNWFSTHADGTLVLYPMLAPNRRLERRPEIVDALLAAGPYRVTRTVDLTHFEREGQYLEGTGSLLLDRAERVAYVCRSPRAHAAPLAAFARALDYEVLAFDAQGADGSAVYHTNVLMWIGERIALVCADAIGDTEERRRVLARLERAHEVVTIDVRQMHEFAGNMLAVRTSRGEPALEMSHRAYHALADAQRRRLHAHFRWLDAHPVYTIERLGGGSVRCMLAEIFLPAA